MAFIKSHPSDPVGERRKRPRDYPGLLAELDDADPAARRWAARDLRDWPAASAALVARLQRSATRRCGR